MAKSLNQVIVMGNVTKHPELKQLPSGQEVIEFSLALNRSYKDAKDEWQEATDYVDVTAWGKLALQCSDRITRGSRVLVTGRLQSRKWEKDGINRTKVDVLAQDVTFLEYSEPVGAEEAKSRPDPIDLSEIPFKV